MATKHTKGETNKEVWYADKNSTFGGNNSIIVSNIKGVIVTLNPASFDSDEEMEATAKKMAAAPDLLKALLIAKEEMKQLIALKFTALEEKKCLIYMENDIPYQTVLKAIKKATK